MALSDPTLDALNATTFKEVYPRVIFDQYFLDTPLAAYLRAKCLVPFTGGAFMQNTHIVRPMLGGAYAPGASWNITKPETLTATLFDPKYAEVAVVEYLETILVENAGDSAFFSLVNTDLSNAMNTISAIEAIQLINHGQSGTGITGNRTINVNGLLEPANDGITPGIDGSVFTSYGGQARNAFVGSTLNSIPYFGGNPSTGGGAPINYAVIEELYQTGCRGRKVLDLMFSNKALYAYIKEKIQPQQRFAQERDPYWGVEGLKINTMMYLSDEYFWSTKFGKNDTYLGNYLASTFTSPGRTDNGGTADPASNLPVSGTTVTVGEPLMMLRVEDIALRVADNPVFGFGWSGFIPTNDNSRVVGTIKAMMNIQHHSPRTTIQAFGFTS